MHVTVAICTWNRANLLDAALTSIAKATIPAGVTWDVIVANNNSTDHTEDVLDKHVGRIPLTRLFISQQGKSYALNKVVELLAGDLVLWTDDDVLVAEDWIASYVDAAYRWSEAVFFGGHIIPRFLGEEPKWLRPAWQSISGVYSARELGDEPFVFDRKRLPFGANMAARVGLQKRYSFDPELGRRGELLLAGEETALMHRWLSDGHVGMWVPQSRVEHMITPDRLEPDHIRRFFFGLAESKRPRDKADRPLVRLLHGGWYACRAMTYQALIGLYPQATQPDRWMKCLKRISYCWGRVESQWDGFPTWLMPAPVKRLKQGRGQPRIALPVTIPLALATGVSKGDSTIFVDTKIGTVPEAARSSPAMPEDVMSTRKIAA
jgi:glucosyl-dolichyl phosphate glucuronosyltransferase